MGRRQVKPEQFSQILREAEGKLAGGNATGEVGRERVISAQSYYRRRN